MRRKIAALLAALLLLLGAMSGCGTKTKASSGSATAGNAHYYVSGGNASGGNARR